MLPYKVGQSVEPDSLEEGEVAILQESDEKFHVCRYEYFDKDLGFHVVQLLEPFSLQPISLRNVIRSPKFFEAIRDADFPSEKMYAQARELAIDDEPSGFLLEMAMNGELDREECLSMAREAGDASVRAEQYDAAVQHLLRIMRGDEYSFDDALSWLQSKGFCC